ncbi:MAG TPA: hypothetical protein VE996_09535 [Terriglobales bacterium]|nr:hypothetical protein [Terriglobales bacterium]
MLLLRRLSVAPALLGCLGLGLAGQAVPPALSSDPTVIAQTVSTLSPIRSAGQPQVTNFFDFGFGTQTGYTDHVNGSTSSAGSAFELLNGEVDVRQERGGLNWALSYAPSYEWYRAGLGLDQFNQTGALDLSGRLNEHWYLRLDDQASYGRYLLNPAAFNANSPLNVTVSAPNRRMYSQTPSASLIYVASYRSYFVFSGDFLTRQYSGDASGLTNMEGAGGSASYQYRLSALSTLGAQYSYENASFGHGTGHMVSQTAFLTYTHLFNARTKIALGAGPQRVHETENLLQMFGVPAGGTLPIPTLAVQPYHTYWAGRASINHESGLTALSLSAQESVSDSGGFLASAARVTSVTGGIGRRFLDAWHVDLDASYARMTAANLVGARGTFQSASASGGIERQLGRDWSLSARFTSTRQRQNGNLPFGPNFNSNAVTLGLSYHLRLARG